MRVTVEDAARLLGIEKGSVKKPDPTGQTPRRERRQRRHVGLYGQVRDSLGRVPGLSATDRDELVGELRDRVRSLERRMDEEREARRRSDTIIAQLTQANAALASRVPELEAPQEPSNGPQTATEEPERAEQQPHPDTGGPQTAAQRPWWRRMFGG